MPGSWKIRLLNLALIGWVSGHMSGLTGSTQGSAGTAGSAGRGAAFLAVLGAVFLATGSAGASMDGGLSGRAFLAALATGAGAGSGAGSGSGTGSGSGDTAT